MRILIDFPSIQTFLVYSPLRKTTVPAFGNSELPSFVVTVQRQKESNMENSAAVQFLESLLGRTLRIHTTDTRMFVGTFKCTDAVRIPRSICETTATMASHPSFLSLNSFADLFFCVNFRIGTSSSPGHVNTAFLALPRFKLRLLLLHRKKMRRRLRRQIRLRWI